MSENLPQKVGSDAPSWLVEAAQADTSLTNVSKYRRLSRMTVVQGSTAKAKARIREFGEGSIVLVPGNTKLAEAKELVNVVPLFMYTEFTYRSDRDDSDSPMILSRSLDEASEEALCARDPKRRVTTYGEQGQYEGRYVESLVFPCVVYDGNFAGTPVTLSFEKGEFNRGKDFCSAIMMRKVDSHTAPLWSQVWAIRSGDGADGHGNSEYEWWGFNYETPDLEGIEERGGAFILGSEVSQFKALAAELEEKYVQNALILEHEEPGEAVAASDDDEEM